MGYSPWGHKESDMTEQLSMHACTCLHQRNINVIQATGLQTRDKPLQGRRAWPAGDWHWERPEK